MKLVARECSAAEKAELRRLLEEEPERRAYLTKLCTSAGIARELLPLVSALEATDGEMTETEMAKLRSEVARVRKVRGKAAGADSQEESSSRRKNTGDEGRDRTVIDAELVPERKVDLYKVLFYSLVSLLVIIGSIFLLKSCNRPMDGGGAQAIPAANGAPAANVEAVKADNRPSTSTSNPRLTGNGPLPSYRGSQWEIAFDDSSQPGLNLNFRQFAVPYGEIPLVEGRVGSNGGSANDLLLVSISGQELKPQTFPSLPTDAIFVGALPSGRVLLYFNNPDTKVALIEQGQAKMLSVPDRFSFIAVHPVSPDQFFLHSRNGDTFEVKGTTVTQLPKTDPKYYIHQDGKPTSRRRGQIHLIAHPDSGETMGIYSDRRGMQDQAALVRFGGKTWDVVCPLDDYGPTIPAHFLSKDSMVAVAEDLVVIVKGSSMGTMGVLPEYRLSETDKLMAVRASSTDEFVLVASNGSVLRYANGRYEREVGPISGFNRGMNFEEKGFRDVMIAPSGLIYGIYTPSQWSRSRIYRLSPR